MKTIQQINKENAMRNTITVEDIIKEIDERFGEVMEYAGPGRPALYGIIATKLLLEERNKVEYLKKRLEHYEHKAAI